MTESDSYNIAIIGGGFSGTMVAIHLLRDYSGGPPVRIILIERGPAFGRGLAYGTDEPRHLLNVRAANMSALPDVPDHFVTWLKSRTPFDEWPAPSDIGEAYAPRRLYGAYVQDLLQDSLTSIPDSVTFNKLQDDVIGLDLDLQSASVCLGSGATISADRVVLALGNLPPKDIPGVSQSFLHSPRYVRDPWSKHALEGLQVDEPLLFVGAGLTMVDLAISLHARGHQGPIHVLSRRGLLPQAHGPAPTIPPFLNVPVDDTYQGSHTVASLLKLIRTESREPWNNGWRSVINSLRAATPALWRSLPLAEKRRFLRHVQTYWDLHRHRMAPETAKIIAAMRSAGQLVVRAGRIVEATEKDLRIEVSIRERRAAREVKLDVGRVINCTGASLDLQHLRHPLLRQLLCAGVVRPDPLGLGLDVDEDGCCIDGNGEASEIISTLGPLRKGVTWETTAVPEIRVQAALLARQILDGVTTAEPALCC